MISGFFEYCSDFCGDYWGYEMKRRAFFESENWCGGGFVRWHCYVRL